jgi:hypothetical protein
MWPQFRGFEMRGQEIRAPDFIRPEMAGLLCCSAK